MRTKDCFGGFGSEAAADLVVFSTALYEESPDRVKILATRSPLVCFERIGLTSRFKIERREDVPKKKCHELKKSRRSHFFVRRIPNSNKDSGWCENDKQFILWINNKRRQPRTMKILLAVALFTLVCVRADNKSNFYENDMFEPLAKLASGKTVFIK